MDITLSPKCESGGHCSTGASHARIIRGVSYGRGHLIGVVMRPFMIYSPTVYVLPTSLLHIYHNLVEVLFASNAL